MKKTFFFSFLLLLGFSACENNENAFDATGTFEATEIIVSSEINGRVLQFNAAEGDVLKAGQAVAKIDAVGIELQKAQVEASIEALGQKRNEAQPDVEVLKQQLAALDKQIATLETQLEVAEKEQGRITRLVKAEAATPQQQDNLDGQVAVLEKQIISVQAQKGILQAQINAAVRKVAIQNRGINSERQPLEKRIAQLDDQVQRSQVLNPSAGTILAKYIHAGEFVTAGKPLYRLADLDEMVLRAYISGDQLAQVAVGQKVKVFVDQDVDSYKEYSGQISWIASKAEFTPKTIQTKDERANLVYAIKIKVPNDGFLKIGMYGEVNFADQKEAE